MRRGRQASVHANDAWQAMGLASIPVIVTPIDCMVHHVADCTYRPHIKKLAAFGTSLLHPPGQEGGFSTGSGAEGADA